MCAALGVGLEHGDERQQGAEFFGLGQLGVARVERHHDAMVVGMLE